MKALSLFDIRGNIEGIVLLDDNDYDRVKGYKWSISKSGYVRRTERQGSKTVNYKLHREILGLDKGCGIVDHRNRNKLDNRKSNLRVLDTSAQAMEGNSLA